MSNNWEDNSIDSIDNRINEVAIAELDGIESELDHIDILDNKFLMDLDLFFSLGILLTLLSFLSKYISSLLEVIFLLFSQ